MDEEFVQEDNDEEDEEEREICQLKLEAEEMKGMMVEVWVEVKAIEALTKKYVHITAESRLQDRSNP